MSDTPFLYHWLPKPNLNTSMLDKLRSILRPEEKEEVDSHVVERHRNEKLVARAMLRRALSDLTGISPLTWQFRRNAYGRPEIAAPCNYRHLKFSVSHAGGLIVCLLSWYRNVGVDVEPIRQVDGMLDIADRYFAPSEAASIRALPGHGQSRGFLELWTLKEAYLKALGSGLSVPITEVAFTIKKGAANQIFAAFGPKLADDPARWQFSLARLDNHLIATAVERRVCVRVNIVMRDAVKLMKCPASVSDKLY